MAFLAPAVVSNSFQRRSNPMVSTRSSQIRTASTTLRAAVPTPLSDRILVRPDKPLEKTTSGLLLSKQEEPRSQSGVVAAVGPGLRRDDGTVEKVGVDVGERVFWMGYAREVQCEGEKMMLVKAEDCCGKV